MRSKAFVAAATCVALLFAIAGCGSSSSGGGDNGSDTIKVGASVPLSGPLAGFGSFVKWGYQHAVDQVNAQGGITVDGKKKKVKLILLDDKTDPNTVANNNIGRRPTTSDQRPNATWVCVIPAVPSGRRR